MVNKKDVTNLDEIRNKLDGVYKDLGNHVSRNEEQFKSVTSDLVKHIEQNNEQFAQNIAQTSLVKDNLILFNKELSNYVNAINIKQVDTSNKLDQANNAIGTLKEHFNIQVGSLEKTIGSMINNNLMSIERTLSEIKNETKATNGRVNQHDTEVSTMKVNIDHLNASIEKLDEMMTKKHDSIKDIAIKFLPFVMTGVLAVAMFMGKFGN